MQICFLIKRGAVAERLRGSSQERKILGLNPADAVLFDLSIEFASVKFVRFDDQAYNSMV